MTEHHAENRGRGPAIGGNAIAARVLIVGRTSLDARLRLDPHIELIRVRTGFDAIGELANPVGEVPGRTLVIVGDGADIGERNGGDGAFVAAVRRVAPDARVLRYDSPGANPPEPGAYDGDVSPSASSDELRVLVHGRPASPETQPETRPETPPTAGPPAEPVADEPPPDPQTDSQTDSQADPQTGSPGDARADEAADHAPVDTPAPPTGLSAGSSTAGIELAPDELDMLRDAADGAGDEPDADMLGAHELTPAADTESGDEPARQPEIEPLMGSDGFESPAEPVPAVRGGDGDDVLVAAALGGRDILEPALGLIRARFGRSDIEFIPESAGDAGRGAAEVAWSGQRFGWLRRSGIDAPPGADDSSAADRLGHHARWLGTWLALAEQQRRLRLEAFTDPVSGAWNRRYFDRFLESAIPHARQNRHKLTVLVFDLDNFKSFNDRFGHEAGDNILSETVRLLRSMTRPSDRICRIGGDEFAVVFYEPEGPRDRHSDHPEAFEVVAARFQRAVEEQRFPKLGIEAPGELTISGGLATFPWDGQTAAELLRKADELAIESKQAGKNQIRFGRSS